MHVCIVCGTCEEYHGPFGGETVMVPIGTSGFVLPCGNGIIGRIDRDLLQRAVHDAPPTHAPNQCFANQHDDEYRNVDHQHGP